MRRFVAASVAIWFAFSVLASCSDDTNDKLKNVASTVQDKTGQVAADALAEALRGALAAKDLPKGQTERNVDVIDQVVRDLPGNPNFTGIEDANGDGKDDDGTVQANVGDQSACLHIANDGNMNVDSGAC
jgi:hypothetical protein